MSSPNGVSPAGSPSPSAPAADDPVIAAWQRALDGEYAAVYGYDTLGPLLTEPAAVALARQDQQTHRRIRDATVTTLLGLGVAPQAARAAYPPRSPVSDAATAQRFALRLEEDCASTWRSLLAAAITAGGPHAGSARTTAQVALVDAAVRALAWRRRVSPSAPTVAFPGIQTGSS